MKQAEYIKHVLKCLPLAIYTVVFSFYPIYTFELEGRLQEVFGAGWVFSLFLSRAVILAPLAISLFALSIKPFGLLVILLPFLLLLGMDHYAEVEIFQSGLVELLFHENIWLWSWLIAFFPALFLGKLKESFIPFWMRALAFILLIAIVFGRYKVYIPEITYSQTGNEQHVYSIPNSLQSKSGFVLFVSTGCNTCYGLTKSMMLLQKFRPEIELNIISYGEAKSIKAFEKATACSINTVLDRDAFFDMTGPRVPVLIQFHQNHIVHQWVGDEFTYPHMDKLYSNPELLF
ncbi:MAG: hypothetical protein ACPF8V_01405 [Luteibaculum sp.]